jgi:hypothetical protein
LPLLWVKRLPSPRTPPVLFQIVFSCRLSTKYVSESNPSFITSHLISFPSQQLIQSLTSPQQAIIVLETGIASKEDIDKTLRLGMAHPMGPLALADFIGLDTCLSIQQVLYEETGDSKYRPSVLLGRMVSAGWMGKKSGKGFYDY